MLTEARSAMIEDGQSSLARWVRCLKSAPDQVLRVGSATMAGDLWTSADLLRVYDGDGHTKTTASAMSRELKRAGFRMVYRGQQVQTLAGKTRLFAVRDRARWEAATSSPAMSAHYNSTRLAGPAKRF